MTRPPGDASGPSPGAGPGSGADGSISVGNEFAAVRISRVDGRNGARVLIESTRTGQWVSLCPLELEALTWQSTRTFSELIGHPMTSLFTDDD